MDKVLVLASVASMIDQFNMPNITLLLKMGYEVHIACNFEKGNTCTNDMISKLKMKLYNLDVKYYQIDFDRNVFNIIQNIKAYKQIYNLIKDNKYKFIHCHSPIGGVCGRLAAKRLGVKVIYTAHGFHFYKSAPIKNWILYYPIEKILARYTDVLITINKEDFFIAKSKLNSKKVVYIPGVGIDVNKFKNINIDKDKKRIELGIPKDAFIVLSIGELNKNKNHVVIIKAIAKLNNPKIYYLICGKGILDNKIKDLAKKYNIENNVKLLGVRDDIIEICSISDIFAHPSYREGLSVALMEAMASGLPVICSNIRGNKDLIEDNIGGYLIKPWDYDDFAKKIDFLIKNETIREFMSRNNRIKIQLFKIEKVLDILRDIYVSL